LCTGWKAISYSLTPGALHLS